uniref:Uncharacterized protein n=1 Tax=Mycena chlorophos TaxID=658473 RepID=A0ABQ0L5F3_MYCCL|nr:predicted protein [Mycena chlorophos]
MPPRFFISEPDLRIPLEFEAVDVFSRPPSPIYLLPMPLTHDNLFLHNLGSSNSSDTLAAAKTYEQPASFFARYVLGRTHEVDVLPRHGVFLFEDVVSTAPMVLKQITSALRRHPLINNRLITSVPTHIYNPDAFRVSVLGREERGGRRRPYFFIPTTTAERLKVGTHLHLMDDLEGDWTVKSIWSCDWWWAYVELLGDDQRRRAIMRIAHHRVQGRISYPHVVGKLIQQECQRGIKNVQDGIKKLVHGM